MDEVAIDIDPGYESSSQKDEDELFVNKVTNKIEKIIQITFGINSAYLVDHGLIFLNKPFGAIIVDRDAIKLSIYNKSFTIPLPDDNYSNTLLELIYKYQ